MTIYDSLFPLGLGTNRFPVESLNDEIGITRSVEMMVAALNAGVSYIDVSHSYSRGIAQNICKTAFQQTNAPHHVTVKSSFLSDKTAEDALRRTKTTFTNLGIDHAFCFVIWNIASYEQFTQIMRKGYLYDGAVSAKQQGLVDHICFSTHAPPQDIIKILNAKVFEGVTISFSILNSQIMRPVLDCAEENGIGVVVMNPLAGGLIPQQQDYYSFLRNDAETSTSLAALRYVYAHPAVKVILSGMSSVEQLRENLAAFSEESTESAKDRVARVNRKLCSINGFCTGCRYCDGCPRGVNIFELMQAYNTTLFPRPTKLYGRSDPKLLENISICSRLKNTFGFLPADSKNPCVGCGQCEEKCTAHLPIMERIRDIYKRFESVGFSKKAMLERLRQIIGSKRRIAFYPGAGYTARVLSLLEEAFPSMDFQLFLFDSNPRIWGTRTAGIEVRNPEEIFQVNPEIIIVSNYNFADEIYDSLVERLKGTVPVVKLHHTSDVPWSF